MPGSALHSRFSRNLFLTSFLFIPFAIIFTFYVWAEKRIDRANDQRYISFQLIDELRQSSDALSMMAHSYVITGDPGYKRQYQNILDIRDGGKQRPREYGKNYWDLAFRDGAPRYSAGDSVSLLELMRRNGFNERELVTSAKAIHTSGQLSLTEREAMNMAGSTGPEAGARRAEARSMIHDQRYQVARAASVKLIEELYEMVDRRTDKAVRDTISNALILRYVFIACALGLLFMLLRTYMALREILGGTPVEVFSHIDAIGRGDFSEVMTTGNGREPSVMSALADTRARLAVAGRERSRAEERLRISEEKFRNLFNNSEVAMFRTKLDGTEILDVNRKCLEYLGKPAEEVIGKPSAILWSNPEERDGLIQKVLVEGRVSGYHHDMRDNQGRIRNCLTSLTLYRDQGILEGSLLDVTELKRSEEERLNIEKQLLHAQKLESLGVLAGGIAHDFNNILMAIMGNADLALMRISKESPVVDNLRAIEQASARAADLARQMLAYSGKGRFVITSLDLGRLIEEMLNILEVSISKKAALRLNLSPDLPSIEADATQMRQVVMNLVINASEAIGDENGIISVTTGCIECDGTFLREFCPDEDISEGTYVCLEVTDSGCGMDGETAKKIFDPFFSTKFIGRGLGLAAVYGIIRGHKGAIRVYSEPGRGASFKVLLPASAKPVEVLNAASPRVDWKGAGKILLVDDEEVVRNTGSEMLRQLGFNVVTANDGEQALEVFKSNPDISFVILDLTMPRMDGEQCFQELKNIRPDVKVIMSSGFSEREVARKFAGKDVAGFVQKPYRFSVLAEAIKGVV